MKNIWTFVTAFMFTGIVETLGKVIEVHEKGTNRDFILYCSFTDELKVDQSLSHNGVCLTVTKISAEHYWVTAVEETLKRSNLAKVQGGDLINLERCMKADGRFDGHIVQGHVDQVGICTSIEDRNGSWLFTFDYDASQKNVTVEKGSVTVNGVSLTVVDSEINSFSVAVIPYTFEHTNFHMLKQGDVVNLEFDIVGKYVKRLMQN